LRGLIEKKKVLKEWKEFKNKYIRVYEKEIGVFRIDMRR
jgi:hypothetical protein